MLYDPKWAKPEVKADPFSLSGLVAWLEQQPKRRRYNYWNCEGKCLYGLYMASHGIAWSESGGNKGDAHPRGRFCSIVYDRVASSTPYTFGAALKRARAALGTVEVSAQTIEGTNQS